ncbi:MAG: hypothetical protein NTX13_07585 [Acidobacteria bacterium]|nr:hypothetical protein [Acidobacteriota bacterium]
MGLQTEIESFGGADVAEHFPERFGVFVGDDDAEADVVDEAIAGGGIVGKDFVFQGIEIVVEGRGFDALGSFEAPEGVGQLLGEQLLDPWCGSKRLNDMGAEGLIFGGVLDVEDDRFGGESMAKCIYPGGGFALLGPGSGTFLGVSAIGGQTPAGSGCGHEYSPALKLEAAEGRSGAGVRREVRRYWGKKFLWFVKSISRGSKTVRRRRRKGWRGSRSTEVAGGCRWGMPLGDAAGGCAGGCSSEVTVVGRRGEVCVGREGAG